MIQSFSALAIIVNYRINRNYIAKNLCVKRYIPQSGCEGKCHLTKQLKEEENKPASQLKIEFPVLYAHEVQSWSVPDYQTERPGYISLNCSPYYPEPVIDFFHPPA
jgi:hypothetical protein